MFLELAVTWLPLFPGLHKYGRQHSLSVDVKLGFVIEDNILVAPVFV